MTTSNGVNYISLKEATQYCSYSQDYLKLRARQGKLKAIKIGRNWITTTEWLQDYVSEKRAPRTTNKESVDKEKRSIPLFPFILTAAVVLIIIGISFNFDLFSEYLGWIHNKFFVIELEKIIPAKVMEIK